MCIYVPKHGIVIIEIYSNNKSVYTLYTVVVSLSYILPKCAKTGEPKDEHCVLQCTYKSYYICDPIPLDNPKNHIALPYITLDLLTVVLTIELIEEKFGRNFHLTEFLCKMKHRPGKPGQPDLYADIFL